MILPLTNEIISILPKKFNNNINNRQLIITFNEKKLQKRKTKLNTIETPSSEELKVNTVVWLKRHKP